MTVPHSGRGWRLADSLIAMEAEANRIAPFRSRASDGSIGDQSHQARKSDHNPDGDKTVDALDLTHSPDKGWDTHARAREVAKNVANGIEKRVEYIISNRQIFSKKGGVWAWRPYTGENGHTHHAHYSVNDAHQDDTSPWFSSVPPLPTKPIPPPYIPPPEDTDVTAYIRLNAPGHKLHGRVEAIGDFHRRHIKDATELTTLVGLGAKVQQVNAREWNVFTANKAVVDGAGPRA